MKALFTFLIRQYQKRISVLLPPVCRFQPTCSEYAIGALARFGLFKGLWLTVKRVSRCHPFSAGGYDPVEREDAGAKAPRRAISRNT